MAAAKKAAELGKSVALFDFVKPSTQVSVAALGTTVLRHCDGCTAIDASEPCCTLVCRRRQSLTL